MTKFISNQLKGNKFVSSERQDLHAVIRWLKVQHPNVIYHFDFGADALLTPRQAKERKNLSWGRGWPDIIIFERRGPWHGLALDLKREDFKIYRGTGLFINDHVERQNEVHTMLRERGYQAMFAKGFESAKKAITDYLYLPAAKPYTFAS